MRSGRVCCRGRRGQRRVTVGDRQILDERGILTDSASVVPPVFMLKHAAGSKNLPANISSA